MFHLVCSPLKLTQIAAIRKKEVSFMCFLPMTKFLCAHFFVFLCVNNGRSSKGSLANDLFSSAETEQET